MHRKPCRSRCNETVEPEPSGFRESKDEGREATAVADPAGATLLMMAWKPGRRGPLPRGASPEEIQAAFPEWTPIDDEAMVFSGRVAEPAMA